MKFEAADDQDVDRIKIYPRGKKKIYCADFWFGGKHHRLSLKTRNAKEARKRANRLESRLDEGNYEPAKAPLDIPEAMIAYFEFLGTEGRRPKTMAKYRGFLKVFQQFCADRRVLRASQLTGLLIDNFRAVRKMTHSEKSMHNEAVMLKSFFKWAKQRGLISANPMAEMRFKRPPLHPRGGPTLQHIDQILSTAKGQRRPLLAVLAFTGMRSGELQRLQLIDVDLTNNWIHVVSRVGAETKTGVTRRVPIHPRLRQFLESLPNRKREWFFTAPASKKFPNGDHFISVKRLNEDFLKILGKLGLPLGREDGFTLHSLRHAFETICVNAGIPQRAIDAWLGHRSDRSMGSVYYRLSDAESQRFMFQVPFGNGTPAADAGDMEVLQ